VFRAPPWLPIWNQLFKRGFFVFPSSTPGFLSAAASTSLPSPFFRGPACSLFLRAPPAVFSSSDKQELLPGHQKFLPAAIFLHTFFFFFEGSKLFFLLRLGVEKAGSLPSAFLWAAAESSSLRRAGTAPVPPHAEASGGGPVPWVFW